ncbi:MAG: CAP domain-containing protein [Nocardioides sp.]|uniref:CAP domain-containing protein n=1 Tax=Nocardioides sp. TaxID=35761 RepID=UPI003F018EB4
MAHPRARRPLTAAAVVLGVTLTLLGAPPAQASSWPVPEDRSSETATDLAEYADQVMVEINAARDDNGMRRVKRYDSCVDRLASRWSKRIVTTGKFKHRRLSRIINHCDQAWAGETLLRGYDLAPEEMVDWWMDSPGHRAVLMSKHARRAGVSVRLDAEGRLVAVVNLTLPMRR